jgi:hypothetical protein
MHAKGKHPVLVLKDSRSAVSLMHIQINDEYSFYRVVMKQITGSDGQVVEQAKSLSAISKGMVRAAGYVEGYFIFQGKFAALDGALHDFFLPMNQG